MSLLKLSNIEKLNIRKKHAELIIMSVSKFFDVNCKENTRKRNIVFPRQIAMYLINKYTNLSQEENGKLFKRDHASVNHAIKTVFNVMSYDKYKRHEINLLENKIVKKTEESELELEKSSIRIDINRLIENYSKIELNNLKNHLTTIVE